MVALEPPFFSTLAILNAITVSFSNFNSRSEPDYAQRFFLQKGSSIFHCGHMQAQNERLLQSVPQWAGFPKVLHVLLTKIIK